MKLLLLMLRIKKGNKLLKPSVCSVVKITDHKYVRRLRILMQGKIFSKLSIQGYVSSVVIISTQIIVSAFSKLYAMIKTVLVHPSMAKFIALRFAKVQILMP